MNSAKQKFLDNLYDETRIEITRKVETEVVIEFKKKLKVMVSNNIISDVEAREFAKSKDISLGTTVTTRTSSGNSGNSGTSGTRTAPSVDPCTRSVSPTAHC